MGLEVQGGYKMNIRAEIHKNICRELNEVYRAKNSDYGNSFTKVREEYPQAILIRLMDKLERLKTLYNGRERLVKDESIDDTLKDLANYCIMELVERRLERTPAVKELLENE